LGVGSTFTLRIPVRYQEAITQQVLPQPEWVPESGKLPVLIIEDSPPMWMMYQSFLAASVFQPVRASTIREAEEVLGRMRPAAIVLDIVLRSEDTWSFLARITADSRTQGIPILVISTIEDQAKAFHLGAHDYMVKPVERVDLISRLRALTDQVPLNRILIIDDNESDRYLWRRQLSEPSFLVSEALDGREGLRKAREQKPALILLDLNMPGMIGFDVLERLKVEESTRNIPVVICTSRVLTSTERNQLAGKAAAIFSKEGLDHSAAVPELQRIINGVEAAAAIGQGLTA
jgi:DNA-binding response OmpR family regulator